MTRIIRQIIFISFSLLLSFNLKAQLPIVNQDSLKIPKVKTESRTKSAGGGSSSGGIAPVSMPIMPSANAASLVRAATASPNLYTGAVNVSIPLVTIPAQGMSVPIGLVYQSNGVKVNDRNGPLGMTWNLQGGGAVARIVRGYPDEFNGLLYEETWKANKPNKRKRTKIKLKGYWNTNFPTDYSKNEKSYQKVIDLCQGKDDEIWDSEPDKYFFSAPGLSGSFYIPKNGMRPILHCDADIDLQVSYKDNEINGFVITTVAGVCYEFGMNSQYAERQTFTIESRNSEARHNKIENYLFDLKFEFEEPALSKRWLDDKDAYTSTWYLKRILTPFNRDILNFTYDEEIDKVEKQAQSLDVILDNSFNYFELSGGKTQIETFHNPENEYYLSQLFAAKQVSKKIIRPKRLTRINCENGDVEFLYSKADINNNRRISNLIIYGSDKKSVVKQICFDYDAVKSTVGEPLYPNLSKSGGFLESLIGDNSLSNKKEDTRYFLNKIYELDKTQREEIKLFSFKYHQYKQLPIINSQQQNQFGFYVNYPNLKSHYYIDKNSNYHPLLALAYHHLGEYKLPQVDFNENKINIKDTTVVNGILTSMQNATGAVTKFAYDATFEGAILKHTTTLDGDKKIGNIDYTYQAASIPLGNNSRKYLLGANKFGLTPWGRSEASLTQGAVKGYGVVTTKANKIKNRFEFTTASDYDNINKRNSTFKRKYIEKLVLFYNGYDHDFSNMKNVVDELRRIGYDEAVDEYNDKWKKVVGEENAEKLKGTILYAEFFAGCFSNYRSVDQWMIINYFKNLETVSTNDIGRPTERDQLRGILLKKETFNSNGDELGVEIYDYSPILISKYDSETPPFIVSESYTDTSDEEYIVPYDIEYESLRLNYIQTISFVSKHERLSKQMSIKKYSDIHPLLPKITLEENFRSGDELRTERTFKIFSEYKGTSTTKSLSPNKDDEPDDDDNGGSTSVKYLKFKPYPKYQIQKQVVKKNGKQVSGSEIVYNNKTRLPEQNKAWVNGEYETTLTYDKLDNKGRILEAHGRDGIKIAYRYKGNFIELAAKNASYEDIKNGKAEDLRKKLDDALITSAVYSQEGYLTSQTDANGTKVYHEYDNFGRLKLVSDFDKNALKAYDYQYGKVGQTSAITRKLGIGEMVLGDNFTVGGFLESITEGLPSAGRNYTSSYTFRKEGALFQEKNKSEKAIKSIEYQDGLGRPIQQISLKTLPGEYSVVKGFEYDSLGRQSTQYRALPMLTNASYKDSWKTYLKSAYQSSYKSESLYDSYNRVSKQGSFGDNYALNAHASTYKYGLNRSGIPSYSIAQGDDEFKAKTFRSGALIRNSVYFEGITNVSYKNMDGQVVRKAAVKGNVTTDPNYDTALITDYVYDDYGNLRAILPPQAKGDINQEKLVYQFHYDDRGRVVKKKIPGAGSIVLAYDDLDRPITETDALGNTSYVKYDEFSRPIETGLRLRSATGTGSDTDIPLQKSHYDNYDFSFAKDNTPSFKNAKENKGRSTGSETKVLGEEIWIKSVNYYDKRGRLIEVISQNNTGGIDKIKNTCDFEGKVLSSVLTKNYRGKEWIVKREYAYGKTGELLDMSHKVNKERKVILNSFKYKPDGALAGKSVHNGKIKTKYEYDELDRMVKTATEKYFELELAFDSNLDGTQNTPYYDGSLSAVAWKTAGEDRLTYSFDYDDYKNLKAANSSDHAYTANYSYNINGNMETLARHDSLGLYQSFAYKYKGNQLDSLQRLNSEEVEVWPGDANNNATVDVDDLLDIGYNYNLKVRPRDTRSDAWMAWWVKRRKGDKTVFSDSNGDGLINEKDTVAINQNLLKSHPIAKINKNNTYAYRYDDNGNMIYDEYKNIEIRYNHLNLPDTIIAHGQGKIINVYLADGSLLQRKVIVIEKDKDGYPAENKIDWLDYQGEFLFQKDRLSKIITEEGYASPSESNKKKLTYHYVVSDHLGHSRVVLDEKENVVQTTAYYPYGLPITDLSSETKNNYLYTGKEFIGEFGLNWYDHHARQYDAEIGRWSAIDPALQAASPYMAMGNNPMMYVDTDGKTWGIFKGIKNAWDYAWDKGNQFARWAEENGIPSAGIGMNYNNGSGFGPSANVNGQPLDLNGGMASMNRGLANASNSIATQLASLDMPNYNYRPLDRLLFPMVGCGPIHCNGILADGQANYPTFNWYDNLNLGRVVWNHWATRNIVPDFLSLGVGFSGVVGVGGSSSVELQWVTRGPQASFYPAITATQAVGAGYSIDATLNIGGARYFGDISDIKRRMLLSNIGEGDVPTGFISGGAVAGAKVGFTSTLGKANNGFIIGNTFNIGVGLPAGPVPINGAMGVSNTWMIHDFYKN
ncbi:DUF6443 domain-containing protein [Ancylomarina sp. YFZ004]